ncbi:MAG: ribonuclease HII [Thermoplasmata archaeon HGW-Thermoplasmata-1]|nr:MAG: ribonuclease HII [Thermoplasmata archaeon HGW-Thermoplasmata-1]
MGPLVVAGVKFADDDALRGLGVRDSKKLSPEQRDYMARQIRKLALSCEVVKIPAEEIDMLRKTMTLNELEVTVFAKIASSLAGDDYYLDAADVKASRFGHEIAAKMDFKPRKVISQHGADDTFPVVSAASIIAKTVRDAEVEHIARLLEPKINLPLGSGYPSDTRTINFLETWYERFGDLPPHVRRSWETCRKIIGKVNVRRLDSF